MVSKRKPLPHWSWEDLEAVLDGFDPTGGETPVRAYLMRGLADEAEQATPRELLQQVLSAGWVMAQMGTRTASSVIDRPLEVGVSAS